MSSQPLEPLPDRSSLQTNAILLIVLGILCGGTFPAIFGIIALVQMDSEPHSAQRMNKVGWIVFWVTLGVAALLFVGVLLFNVLMFGALSLPVLLGG